MKGKKISGGTACFSFFAVPHIQIWCLWGAQLVPPPSSFPWEEQHGGHPASASAHSWPHDFRGTLVMEATRNLPHILATGSTNLTFHATNPCGIHGLSRCMTAPQSNWWGEMREYSFKFSSGSSALPHGHTVLNPTGWPPSPEGELQPVTLGRNIMLSLLFPSLQNFIKPCILPKCILSLCFQNQVCCT